MIPVDHSLNILGEFKNKELEAVYRNSEVGKSKKLVRFMLLFAGIANLVIGLPDALVWKTLGAEVLAFAFSTRIIILAIGIVLFILLKKIHSIKLISSLICGYASLIYVTHLGVALYSNVPIPILFETFNLVILTTCLFFMPNRWCVNMGFSLAFIALYCVITPYLCTLTSFGERITTYAYVCWNTIIISVLFYSINIYKRNQFSKELQLEQLANTDHLTKIPNRKSFDAILEGRCRENAPFSLIMFDIDNFKQINDNNGHVAGDDVIVSISNHVRTIIRKDDILARWGGDEFVILMPGTHLNAAYEIAKRIREQISMMKQERIKQTISCSFGVTSFVTGDNAKSVISRADQLLYLAKEYGRNRVVPG